MQTHYQEHQELARRNSRKLSLAFWVCLLLSSASYGVLSYFLIDLFYLNSWVRLGTDTITQQKDTISLGWPLGLSCCVSFICFGIVLWGYIREQGRLNEQSAIGMAQRLGAELLSEPCVLKHQQYRNVVEEMAIASGLPIPSIMILTGDYSINAFVTGDVQQTTAITVSQGAIDYLTREELQALIAHEFGHIYNEDIKLNNRMKAILHGFFSVKELAYESFRGIEADVRFGLFSIIILGVSSIMLFFGRLLQSAFSREREWLADAHAVQYTRNKDALAAVFTKALALQSQSVGTIQISQEHAHFLFINYDNDWLSTHPSLEKRLARYGKVPLQSELNSLAYQLKQFKHSNDLKNDKLQSSNKSYASNFVIEQFYPLLAIQTYQQQLVKYPVYSAEVAAMAILGQFILLSKTEFTTVAKKLLWNEEQKQLIEASVIQLQRTHPITHMQQFLHYLPEIKNYESKSQLIKDIKALIRLDKQFELCEMSYWLCLQAYLSSSQSSNQSGELSDYHDEVVHLLSIVATISSEEIHIQKSNFQLLMMALWNHQDIPFSPCIINNQNVQKLCKDIQKLNELKPALQQVIVTEIEKNMMLDGQISTVQHHLLSALQTLFYQQRL